MSRAKRVTAIAVVLCALLLVRVCEGCAYGSFPGYSEGQSQNLREGRSDVINSTMLTTNATTTNATTTNATYANGTADGRELPCVGPCPPCPCCPCPRVEGREDAIVEDSNEKADGRELDRAELQKAARDATGAGV